MAKTLLSFAFLSTSICNAQDTLDFVKWKNKLVALILVIMISCYYKKIKKDGKLGKRKKEESGSCIFYKQKDTTLYVYQKDSFSITFGQLIK